jgi:DNA polymerase-1
MDKLVIVDGNAIMHRAFHAMPMLSTPKGEPINAVHGLISMLLHVIQTLKPTHLAFCFDEKEPTFRKKLLKTYQSQRPEMDTQLSSQFPKALKFLDTAKIPVYSKSGYEADDVIGTIATKLDNVTIVTGDRDILQLVDDKRNIKLFMPIAGLSNGKLFGEKETYERMGVVPNQIPDLKALIGDASDNYFGVAGIGPVTATKLLTEYKSINNIYTHIDAISPKIGEKLIKDKENAMLSFKLATIDRDVPVKFDLPQMEKWKLDSPEVVKLFTDEFGFKTLTERIKKVGKILEDEKQGSLF